MNNIENKLFDESFWRADKSIIKDQRLFDTFYNLFLSSSPDIAEKFQNTDFKRQKNILRESFFKIIDYYFTDKETGELEKIAESHNKDNLDIAPHYYEFWLNSLIEAVSIHDPEFNSRVERIWRQCFSKGIRFMSYRYGGYSPQQRK